MQRAGFRGNISMAEQGHQSANKDESKQSRTVKNLALSVEVTHNFCLRDNVWNCLDFLLYRCTVFTGEK